MFIFPVDFPTPPINQQSKIIEERYYEELVSTAIDSRNSMVYLQQVPNVQTQIKSKPISNRMAKLKKAGLIGCLNDTEVTSRNYKKIICESIDSDSSI